MISSACMKNISFTCLFVPWYKYKRLLYICSVQTGAPCFRGFYHNPQGLCMYVPSEYELAIGAPTILYTIETQWKRQRLTRTVLLETYLILHSLRNMLSLWHASKMCCHCDMRPKYVDTVTCVQNKWRHTQFDNYIMRLILFWPR